MERTQDIKKKGREAPPTLRTLPYLPQPGAGRGEHGPPPVRNLESGEDVLLVFGMDISLLISSVREREPLWNRQHPQYKDRELAGYLWSQVAGLLAVDVETARYKWRGLRDTYRVQLRKLKRPGLRGLTKNLITSRWEYFNDMAFVKDHIYLDVNSKSYKIKRLKEGHFEQEDDANGYDDDISNDYQNLEELCETEMTEGDGAAIGPDIKTEKSETDNNVKYDTDDINSRLGSEDNYFDRQSNNSHENLFTNGLALFEDDNFCFLLSILPQLKSLPSNRNLHVRIQMQKLLLKEVDGLQNGESDGATNIN